MSLLRRSFTIEVNQKTTHFLDITMDLQTGEYKPYMKPNNRPLHIHKESNHPPSIIKNMPENINQRLSAVTSNETVFKKVPGSPSEKRLHIRIKVSTQHKYQQASNGKRGKETSYGSIRRTTNSSPQT